MRLDDALRQAREQLAASPSPGLDAELLLCRVIGESRTYLRTWPERTLSDSQQRVFQALVRRRAEGEPVAHLTGALGRPLWVMLTFNADWRWLRERDDSPWYPTARLFRQTQRGDWQGVVDRIARELAVMAQHNGANK